MIRITGVRCDIYNVVNIVDIFDLQCVAMTIDSVAEGSSFLKFVEKSGFKYLVRTSSPHNAEITVVLPYSSFARFLDKAMNEQPENIFLCNLLDCNSSVVGLQCSYEELVIKQIADVCISVSLDENTILIRMNRFLLPTRDVLKKIKSLDLN